MCARTNALYKGVGRFCFLRISRRRSVATRLRTASECKQLKASRSSEVSFVPGESEVGEVEAVRESESCWGASMGRMKKKEKRIQYLKGFLRARKRNFNEIHSFYSTFNLFFGGRSFKSQAVLAILTEFSRAMRRRGSNMGHTQGTFPQLQP